MIQAKHTEELEKCESNSDLFFYLIPEVLAAFLLLRGGA